MKQATRFSVHMRWKMLIADMGFSPADVLALARLPGDLFARPDAHAWRKAQPGLHPS